VPEEVIKIDDCQVIMLTKEIKEAQPVLTLPHKQIYLIFDSPVCKPLNIAGTVNAATVRVTPE
jgi:hypothetical protein